jgi:hypothetical protein
MVAEGRVGVCESHLDASLCCCRNLLRNDLVEAESLLVDPDYLVLGEETAAFLGVAYEQARIVSHDNLSIRGSFCDIAVQLTQGWRRRITYLWVPRKRNAALRMTVPEILKALVNTADYFGNPEAVSSMTHALI